MEQEKALQDVLEAVGYLKDNMATKTDLEQFATKTDLEQFATKTDIEQFATKTDIEQFATKDDFSEIREVAHFLKDNMVSREGFDERIAEVKTEIMTHVDGFIVLHQKLDQELTALRAKYDRLEDQIQQVARHLQFQLQ